MKISAREFFDGVLDPGSYRSWDREPIGIAASPRYRSELAGAAERSGTDESVLTGEGLLRGRRVAIIACEFGFLAGSIGVAAAERIVTAIERATAAGLPLLASPTSGGTRMQEGTVAFVQMVKIAGAVAAHKSAGHPYLVYLRNPTMGGVFASWGSLGHMTFAEPGALIGFLGPRVYEALYDRPFPAGVQVAENLYRNGVIDGVVPVRVFRRIAHRVLNVTVSAARQPVSVAASGRPGPDESDAGERGSAVAVAAGPDVGERGSAAGSVVSDVSQPDSLIHAPNLPRESVTDTGGTAWQSVLISRDPARPGIRELLRQVTDRVPLSGTGQGESDRTAVHALARLRGEPCVIFGHDRAGQTAENTMGPAALREARRSMHLAAELRLPLVW